MNTTNTSAKLVVLLSEVLNSGKGCPVCGGEKTKRARTCAGCLRAIGPEATQAVDAVADAVTTAQTGHQAAVAASGPVTRNVVWGPILAQVRINANASLRDSGKGIGRYWDCQKIVGRGFISMFVFGAEEAHVGDHVTALVELKIKDTPKGKVCYLRAQVVQGVKSNVELAIGRFDDECFVAGLSIQRADEQGRRFSVGFVPADQQDAETPAGEDSAEAKAMLAELGQTH